MFSITAICSRRITQVDTTKRILFALAGFRMRTKMEEAEVTTIMVKFILLKASAGLYLARRTPRIERLFVRSALDEDLFVLTERTKAHAQRSARSTRTCSRATVTRVMKSALGVA